jgi:hypothetical protein
MFKKWQLPGLVIFVTVVVLACGSGGSGVSGVSGVSGGGCGGEDGDKYPVPPGFKIAFIGDQGTGSGARSVLELIRDEETDMVLHQGDFDYNNDPDTWMQQIDDILGPTFPYFASVGNHDVVAWEGYQSKLLSRLNRIEGAICTGDLGVNSACTYKGIYFVLSGIGTIGSNHIECFRKELANSNADWKICSWHKNQHLMQVGGKPDEVGWEAYEACRLAGAIIATGHEHSYSRTYLMSNFESQTIASTSNNLILSEGESFAFVSGLGGVGIRPQVDRLGDKPWWASVYTADENANFGALFCSFNSNGNENEAVCYFKDIDGNIVDSFNLTSRL